MILAALLLAAQHSGVDVPSTYLTPKPKPDTVIVKVNGKPITAAQLEPLLYDWNLRQTAQEYAAYEVLRLEAAKEGIKISEAEVNAAFKSKIEQAKKALKPGQTLQQLMAEQSFTNSKLYLSVKADILLDKMADQGFTASNYVKVSTIEFRPDNDQTTALADAIKKADDAYAKLQKGEKWLAVLQTATTQPEVLKNEGLIGWKTLSVFPASVQTQFASMAPGGVSKPAQTPNGIQIFRLEQTGKMAKGTELEDLKKLYHTSSRNKLLARLRQEMKIEYVWPKP